MTAWGTTEKRKETGALRKGKMNYMVRVAGLEPARLQNRQILSLLRLPIPPHPHILAEGVGFEPTHNGFRDRRATDTLPLNIYEKYKVYFSFILYIYYIIFF